MASIRVSNFKGLRPKVGPKLLANNEAQVAQNTRLRDGRLRPSLGWLPHAIGDFITVRNFSLGGGLVLGGTGPSFHVDGVVGISLSNTTANGSNVVLTTPTADVISAVPNFYPPAFLPAFGAFGWAVVQNQTISKQFISDIPMPRTYAITAVTRQGESPPIALGSVSGSGNSIVCDGDIVTLNLAILSQAYEAALFFNIYRTVSEPRTGENSSYEFSTDFLLIRNISKSEMVQNGAIYTVGVVDQYVESLAAQTITSLGAQTITSEDNVGPYGVFIHVGKLDSGRRWLVGLQDGIYTLCVSKLNSIVHFPREWQIILADMKQLTNHRPPSWPPTVITGAVSYGNSVIVGTEQHPIVVTVQDAEDGAAVIDMRSLDIPHGCYSNTLCATPFGAIYVSASGIVAISGNSQSTVSSELFEFGPDFWKPSYSKRPAYAFYWEGTYYIVGLINETTGLALQVNPKERSVDFGELTTFTHPKTPSFGRSKPHLAIPTPSEVYGLFRNGVFRLPKFRGIQPDSQSVAIQEVFKWRSKKFVMPGPTAFSAAKVVHTPDAMSPYPLVINIYADGRLVLNRAINHSRPFRLPRSRRGTEWEFELCGTAVVDEVHIATSMEELTEVYNNDG